jgi:hypothetical protein
MITAIIFYLALTVAYMLGYVTGQSFKRRR